MLSDSHISGYLGKLRIPPGSQSKIMPAIEAHVGGNIDLAGSEGEVEKILAQTENTQSLITASLSARERYAIETSRNVDYFYPTRKLTSLSRNQEKHELPRSSYTYALRTFVPDEIRHVLTKRRDTQDSLGSDKLFHGMPFDPENIGDDPFQLLVDGLPELSSLPPNIRKLVRLFHARTVLTLLSDSKPSQRLRDKKPTSRIFETSATGDQKRVGIYQTSSTRQNHGGRKVPKKKTNLRVFSDADTALRSQDHAIEGLEVSRLLYTKIREGIREYLSANLQSTQARGELIAGLISDIGDRSGHWFSCIRDNLIHISPDKTPADIGRASSIIPYAIRGIRSVVSKKAEIASTRELIQSLGQFSE